MSGIVSEERTRCAFVVCRLDEDGEPRIVLINDPRWGDYTLIGGHEEPEDHYDLERTARRETLEELGCFPGCRDFKLQPLTEETRFGPVWSKSARCEKAYTFKYYGIQFACDPNLKPGYNDAGFLIRFFGEKELVSYSQISNVVRIFLTTYQKKLNCIPLSWPSSSDVHDGKSDDKGRPEVSRCCRMLEVTR